MFQLLVLHQQKAVRMSFDDDTITEILLLEGENTEETVTSPVYDLNGMQKSGISKGWNIVNGKKILIKLHSTLALPTAPNLSNSETNVFLQVMKIIFNTNNMPTPDLVAEECVGKNL